jgi:ribonuclease E
MLIDAAYADEIRVAIIKDGVLDELDYQNSQKKSTKGNIYLAKITRVEPSLQAAFVEYGGNRHGFLPFAEIHPDYYQIPVSDREKLLEEIRAANGFDSKAAKEIAEKEDETDVEAQASIEMEKDEEEEENGITLLNAPVIDSSDEEGNERPDFYKRYKIQEVIKKDQVVLVQIEKEERGNKGAALTTYISLAGRYCVLMPNSTKHGGISRKISDTQDRDRLRNLAREMTVELSGGGAVIIRTAGAFKTKTEIKRDCAYLQKLWDNIRDHTIKSNAPTFIHEEGGVIKKAIRDLYDNDIEEILVQGDSAFKEAKEFMQLILAKHVSKVRKHNDKAPIFSKMGMEKQVAELYSNHVSLKSGGYLIINQAEALVAIDVNSGRATSERNVEGTAYRTNLEAAKEIARQLRLRDLSGLIVIDFIDMEENRNKRSIEKALKESLASDKAKIQMGRISHFGLLEMSRQRIKQSFMESNTQICENCQGRGRIRQVEASSLAVLRAIENEISTDIGEVTISASSALISYILNNKRIELAKIDNKFKGRVLFMVDESAGGDGFFIEKKRQSKDIMAKGALSKIDDASVEHISIEEVPEETDFVDEVRTREDRETNGRRNRNEKRTKNYNSRGSKFKIKRPSKDLPADDIIAQDFEEHGSSNVADMAGTQEIARVPHKHKWKKNSPVDSNNYKKKGRKHEMDFSDENESREEAEFESEMAARRKANQSLLKEIWKKIVD